MTLRPISTQAGAVKRGATHPKYIAPNIQSASAAANQIAFVHTISDDQTDQVVTSTGVPVAVLESFEECQGENEEVPGEQRFPRNGDVYRPTERRLASYSSEQRRKNIRYSRRRCMAPLDERVRGCLANDGPL